MPNYIRNRLVIGSRVDEVLRFLEGERGAVDFNKIAPMPEILNRVVADGKKHPNVRDNGDAPFSAGRPATKQEFDEIRATGYPSWYEWRLANWGVKWNASESAVIGNIVTFETPWACVIDLLCALSQMFPDVEFQYSFADEDIGSNCGKGYIINGVSTVEEPDSSNAKYELAFELWPDRKEDYAIIDGQWKWHEREENDNE